MQAHTSHAFSCNLTSHAQVSTNACFCSDAYSKIETNLWRSHEGLDAWANSMFPDPPWLLLFSLWKSHVFEQMYVSLVCVHGNACEEGSVVRKRVPVCGRDEIRHVSFSRCENLLSPLAHTTHTQTQHTRGKQRQLIHAQSREIKYSL